MLNATICTIGDEILIGQIIDTNSAFISKELNKLGVKVDLIISVPDRETDIISNLERCISLADIVIVTGGLGPTKDDITKAALAKLSGCKEFRYDSDQLEIIEEICKKRGLQLSDLNRNQALVPESCTVLKNTMGTAPGMIFILSGNGGKSHTLLFSLPGVPYEMVGLFPQVIRTIEALNNTETIYHKSISTFGIPESVLASLIEKWEDELPEAVKLAYLPNPLTGVRLRISIYGGTYKEAESMVKPLLDNLKKILGNALYGENEDTLEMVISRHLRKTSCTMATAESCTGGKIASMMTSLPGASDIYKGSVISYDNDVKFDLLGVDRKIIEEYGAVSSECVMMMASGVRSLLKADYAVAASGIAGPDGGTPEKPVGTIWIAVAGPGFCESKKLTFNGDRQRNIDRFSSEALNTLRLKLGIQLV
ncbi:MAG: CinA family nicotinamide mononucleotide deamidase-related protein [Bacteroidales bacterium]|jgi:nicotinamide-nucleotide amidase